MKTRYNIKCSSFIPLEYHYFSAQCPCSFAPSWHEIRNRIR